MATRQGVYEEEESDVTLDEEFLNEMGWLDLEEDSFRQKCREIGILGEKYVLDAMKDYYVLQLGERDRCTIMNGRII